MSQRTRLLASIVCIAIVGAGCGGAGDDETPATPVTEGGAGSAGASAAAGGGAGESAGAGAGGGLPAATVTPLAPMPPALPRLSPCPQGWAPQPASWGQAICEPGPLPAWACPEGTQARTLTTSTGRTHQICEPVAPQPPSCAAGWQAATLFEGPLGPHAVCRPSPIAEACEAGTMVQLGAEGCQVIGDHCPQGDHAEGLPASGVTYVKAGAAGGDGTQAKPFATIGEALAKVAAGGVIAVGKGVYAEAVSLPRDVSLIGACEGAVTIESPEGGDAAATLLVPKGVEAVVKNVRVRGPRAGVWIEAKAKAALSGISVEGARGNGIRVYGEIEADGVVVRATDDRADGEAGRALSCWSGAKATVRRSSFVGNRGIAVSAAGTASLSMSDVTVLGTDSTKADATKGVGVRCEGGSTVVIERAVLDQNRDAAVFALDAGTSLTMTDVVISRTRARESDGSFGRAIDAEGGASVTVQQGLFEDNRDVGAYAGDTGTTLTLREVTVSGTRERQDGGGIGVAVVGSEAATVLIEGGALFANRDGGIAASGANTTLTARGVLVQGATSAEAGGPGGRGVNVQSGAAVTLERAVVNQTQDVAVFVDAASLTMRDSLVLGTTAQADKTGGDGLWAQFGAKVEVDRTLFEQNRDTGIFASGAGTSMALRDVAVVGTLGSAADGKGGRGLSCQEGASVVVERGLFDGNRDVGALATGAGTSLKMSNVAVLGTQCEESGGKLGRGLTAQLGASVEVEQALFDGNHEAGVIAFSEQTTVTLRDIVVRGTEARSKDEDFGRGVGCEAGAKVTVERGLIEDNRDAGVLAAQAASSITLRDVVVRGTRPQKRTGEAGRGVTCQGGARVAVERAMIEGNRDMGVFAAEAGSELTMSDVTIRQTQAQEANRGFGRGVGCQGGARVSLERGVIEQNLDFGAMVAQPGSSLSLTDVVVRSTAARQYDESYGMGIAGALGAEITLTRVASRGNRVAALLLQSSKATLVDCELADTIEGSFAPVDEAGQFTQQAIVGVADGLVALDRSTVTASKTTVSGCTRAGLLFSDSAGQLTEVTSSAGRYGLALRMGAEPGYDETCSFVGAEADVLPGGDLPVPNAPLPLPSAAGATGP